jgi:hypothetical protein
VTALGLIFSMLAAHYLDSFIRDVMRIGPAAFGACIFLSAFAIRMFFSLANNLAAEGVIRCTSCGAGSSEVARYCWQCGKTLSVHEISSDDWRAGNAREHG